MNISDSVNLKHSHTLSLNKKVISTIHRAKIIQINHYTNKNITVLVKYKIEEKIYSKKKHNNKEHCLTFQV